MSQSRGVIQAFLFIFSFSCLSSVHASPLDDETIIFSVVPFPPFYVKDENGEMSGIHGNLGHAVYKKANLKMKFVTYPYARVRVTKKEGKLGMMQHTDTGNAEENNSFLFPIPEIVVSLASITLNPDIQLSSSAEAYQGRSVGTVIGWPLGPFTEMFSDDNPNIKMVKVSKPDGAIKMLYKDRIDILLMFEGPFHLITHSLNIPTNKAKIHRLYSTAGYSFAIPKDYKYAEELNKRLTDAYQQMVKEGLVNTDQVRLKDDDPAKYF